MTFKKLPWAVVLLSLATSDIAVAETTSLGDAARRFRIATYNRYRTVREEYDRRIQIGQDVLLLQGEHSNEDIVRWFLDAAESADSTAPLPIKPNEAIGKELAAQPRGPLTIPMIEPDDPASSIPQHQAHASSQPAVKSAAGTREIANSQPATIAVSIDLNVLTAQIESNNLRIQSLEDELANSKRWFTDELELIVDDVEMILARRETSTIYWDLLSDQERKAVPQLASPKTLLSDLGRRLFESQLSAHERIETSHSSDSEKVKGELATLRKLSRRIQTWQNQ